MRRGTLYLALLIASATALAVSLRWGQHPEPARRTQDLAKVEAPPVTPWRNPTQDLALLFPPATHYTLETRVVSRMTAPIQKQLGRSMHPDENPLRIHRVLHERRTLGSVLVTRVKAEHGGIEIVTGVETNGAVRGVLIQSQREPHEVAQILLGRPWLGSLAGRTASSNWRVGDDLPEPARVSARAVLEGVRDQLVVLGFAESLPAPSPSEHAPHP